METLLRKLYKAEKNLFSKGIHRLDTSIGPILTQALLWHPFLAPETNIKFEYSGIFRF